MNNSSGNSTESMRRRYDKLTVKNILGEDFFWKYDFANVGEEFMLPKDESVTLNRGEALHLLKKLSRAAITKFEWYEVNKNGKMVKQYGGILTTNKNLIDKYTEMALLGTKRMTAPKPSSVGEAMRQRMGGLFGKTSVDNESFENLNDSTPEADPENIPSVDMQDVDDMTWKEVQTYGSEQGVYESGMNRAQVTAAIAKKRTEEQ